MEVVTLSFLKAVGKLLSFWKMVSKILQNHLKYSQKKSFVFSLKLSFFCLTPKFRQQQNHS